MSRRHDVGGDALLDDAGREAALRARCRTSLHGHGPRDPAALLAEAGTLLSDERDIDRYGAGGVVGTLEEEVAGVLGMPAAVFLPTGTMAQQIALRLHADSRGRRTVLLHPTAHPALHESEALERLHGLVLRPVGDGVTPLTVTDLESVAEPPAALLLELPQREIGGPLPTWESLEAQAGWARERGAAVHLDGARLWECGPAYGRSYAEIAALFDTVYVSFYKGLGGIAGACLAGPADVIAEAREWRHRHGGQVVGLWPYAASALAGLRERLPRMPAYVAHMAAIAEELRGDPDVRLAVDPPRVPMAHVLLRTSAAALRSRAVALAARDGIWTWGRSFPTPHPDWRRVELVVGDATMAVSARDAAAILRHLAARPGRRGAADEPVEVVDGTGAVLDVVPRAEVRTAGLRHRCTYVVVLTGAGEVVVHRRAAWKDVNADMWDLAFGGICDVGEPWDEAAARELAEEAGLDGVPLTPIGDMTWEGDGAALVGRAYAVRHDGRLSTPDGEVAEVDRVPLSEVAGWVAAHPVCRDTAEALLPLLLRHLDRLEGLGDRG